jgi:hypothetical protein
MENPGNAASSLDINSSSLIFSVMDFERYSSLLA